MTDHQDRPDTRQRRRVTQLRKALGLTPVPAHVGTELRRIAPRVSEQVVRLLRHDPACLALSPEGQRLLLSAVGRAVDEFARLVEDRPTKAPPVEVMLVELVRVEGRLESCRTAVHAASQMLREVTRVLWPQIPQARPFSTLLDAALARYAKGLCARAMNARQPPAATRSQSTGAPHADGLLAHVEHRWGGKPVQLHLSVHTLGAADALDQRRTAPRHTPRALSFALSDHVATITDDPAPPKPVPTAQPQIVVGIGPVPVDRVAMAHDTALLLLRLIRAGVATPPSPVLVHAPNFGFLRPSPTDSTVEQITDLLLPLSGHGSHRRSALARTLQLCLRTATTAQDLAKQLAMHPQTVHNHLNALRSLYNPNLDFAEDNLAMQAALDLVLPLWELEAGGRRSSSLQGGRKLSGNRPDAETLGLP